MNLQKENLGLSPQMRDDLYNNLNVIINCAGTVEFDTRLDIATDINVRGTLLLMKLAEKCQNFEVFCHVSTLYALVDKTGFIDEKMHSSHHDWYADYEKIISMNVQEIVTNQQQIIQKFPNNYCYSKRMAEELLHKHQ
jgi:thioester reductase-like protein